ncbi:MAG: DUF6178 family protein [Desulfomonilaceae bacterium]
MKNNGLNEYDRKIITHLDDLSLERKLDLFRKLSPLARQAFLLNLSESNDLIGRISEEEIYFIVKTIGVDDADPLLRLTTSRQFKYILDLELWKQGVIDFQSAAFWLNKIVTLGEKKVRQFLGIVDPECLMTILHKLIKVNSARLDIDLVEQLDFLPYFTLDNMFFVDFRDKAHEDTVKILISYIFNFDDRFYFNLMENLATSSLVEIEDIACKLRNARLADKGFPDFEEALNIYQYISPSSKNFSLQNPDQGFLNEVDNYSFTLVDYPIKLVSNGELFRDCLNLVKDHLVINRIAQELANLGNKVIVADLKDPWEYESFVYSLEKVSGYISLALEKVCGNDIDKCLLLLRNLNMEILFRVGYSVIVDFQKEAANYVKLVEGGMENLGYPLSGLLKGLFNKRPFFDENLISNKKRRNFNSLHDINVIREFLLASSSGEKWEPI